MADILTGRLKVIVDPEEGTRVRYEFERFSPADPANREGSANLIGGTSYDATAALGNELLRRIEDTITDWAKRPGVRLR